MKSQGEIAAAICEGLRRFEKEYMARGPKDSHAHLIDDLLVVRLQGLTAAEQHLVKSLTAETGRDLRSVQHRALCVSSVDVPPSGVGQHAEHPYGGW